MTSPRVGRWAGIDIYLHWTFLALFAVFVGAGLLSGDPLGSVLRETALLLAVFGCVLLHEMGHALAARGLGIRTRDITLSPIGGVARLERMPDKPWQELWVAVAGPMVNVAIAAALAALLWSTGGRLWPVALEQGAIAPRLLYINVALVAFNMLPAFPMDGGRVLRAVLAMFVGRRAATRVAAGVGQAMAVLFAALGLLYGPWTLILVAVFVFFAARSEQAQVERETSDFGRAPRDGQFSPWDRPRSVAGVMTRDFRPLSPHDSLEHAAGEFFTSRLPLLPVVEGQRLLGVLRRAAALRALSAGARPLVGWMLEVDAPTIDARVDAERAAAALRRAGLDAALVSEGDAVVGVFALENLAGASEGWSPAAARPFPETAAR